MSQSPSRFGPRALSLLVILLLAVAGFFYFERPWQSVRNTAIEEAVGEVDPESKEVEEAKASEDVAKVGHETRPSSASSRKEIEVETQVTGRFVATLGPWPGGGQAELRQPAEMPEGGWMGLMNMGLSKARQEMKKEKAGKKSENSRDFLQRLLGRGAPIASVGVDAHGRFVFDNPPAGDYVLSLAHPRLDVAAEVEVQVAIGENRDLGPVMTEPAASLLVIVSDAEGEPVPSAKVTLRHKMDMGQFMNPEALENMAEVFQDIIPLEKMTDDRGVCRYEGMEFARPWILEVKAKDLEPVTRMLQLRPGQETVEQVRMVGGAGIQVSVELPNGKPAPKIRMSLVPVDAPENPPASVNMGIGGMSQAARLAAIRFRSDLEGLAEKKGLVPGRYILKSSGPGYLPGNLEIALERDVVHKMRFRLDAGLSVSGRVVDMEGEPVVGARVMHVAMLGQKVLGISIGSMVGKDMLALGAGKEGIEVDEQGYFHLGGFEKGKQAWLLAVADGYDVRKADPVPAGSKGIELRLEKAVSLKGRVADGDGKPVESFRVRLSQSMWMFIQRDVVNEQFSGRLDGSFEISPISREGFKLHILAEGLAPFSKSVSLEKGTLDLGEIRLKSPGVIEGVTVDPEGRPVGGVVVRIAKGGVQDSLMFSKAMGQKLYKSDATGKFEIGGLRPRRIRLLADKDGYAPGRSKIIKVLEGKTTSGIRLALTSGGKMDGLVRNAEGDPMRGWRVQVGLTNGRFAKYGKTDEQGRFHLEALAAGVYKVDAFPEDFMSKLGASGYDPQGGGDLGAIIQKAQKLAVSERCVVKAGETVQVELLWEAEAHGPVSGVAVEGEVSIGGQPLISGMVSLFKPGQSLPAQLVKVRDGHFSMAAAQPGHYRLQVQREALGGLVGRPQQIDLPDVKRHKLLVRLPGGKISGRVVYKETGEVASGVVLNLRKAKEFTAGMDIVEIGEGTHMTGDKGTFSFEGLGAGTYSIMAKELGFSGGKPSGANLSGLALAEGAEMTGLEILLGKGGQLSVQALGPGGAKRNALVTLLDQDGKPMLLFPRMLTDEEGFVRFEGLPKGGYRVLVEGPGLAPGLSGPLDVQEGRQQDARVQLQKGVAVSLRWSGKLPSPMPRGQAFYSVWDQKGVLMRSGRMSIPADPSKEMVFGRFLPGKYRLFLQQQSLGVYEGVHDLPNKTRATWNLQLDGR